MTNPQKNKGDRAERALVAWLRTERGLDAERVRAGRSLDPGDIVWTDADGRTCRRLVDVKDRRTWALPAWWREITAEADSQGLDPLLVLKWPGATDVGEWLAVTRIRDTEL